MYPHLWVHVAHCTRICGYFMSSKYPHLRVLRKKEVPAYAGTACTPEYPQMRVLSRTTLPAFAGIVRLHGTRICGCFLRFSVTMWRHVVFNIARKCGYRTIPCPRSLARACPSTRTRKCGPSRRHGPSCVMLQGVTKTYSYYGNNGHHQHPIDCNRLVLGCKPWRYSLSAARASRNTPMPLREGFPETTMFNRVVGLGWHRGSLILHASRQKTCIGLPACRRAEMASAVV